MAGRRGSKSAVRLCGGCAGTPVVPFAPWPAEFQGRAGGPERGGSAGVSEGKVWLIAESSISAAAMVVVRRGC